MTKRVVLINNILGPLRFPIYNILSQAKGINLLVFFLAKTDPNRRWDIPYEEIHFNYKLLPGINFLIEHIEMPIYFNWGLMKELKFFQPDIICIVGYHYLASIIVLLYAKLTKTKIVLWSGSHLLSGFIKNPLIDFYKKTIVPKFDSYITYGTAAKEQIIHYGAKPERIIVSCNTIDVEWFIKKSQEVQQGNELKEIKKKYRARNILYVGSFVARKGVFNLIKAFYRLNMYNVGLILIGDGIEKSIYLEYIKEHQIKNVFFEGFVQKENIVRYYGLADVFVLPSSNEVWGLVVNEAMACGLPVISSKLAGVTRDLVKDGKNGFSFNPNDIDELTQKLRELILNDKERVEMGKKSLEIIKDKTPQEYAKSILKAIELSITR